MNTIWDLARQRHKSPWQGWTEYDFQFGTQTDLTFTWRSMKVLPGTPIRFVGRGPGPWFSVTTDLTTHAGRDIRDVEEFMRSTPERRRAFRVAPPRAHWDPLDYVVELPYRVSDDGAWSEWSMDRCSVNCGKGEATYRR